MLNRISIMGRITAEPELRATQNGTSVASFTVAVERDTKDKETDFISCVAWRQTGEFVSKYFHKGSMIVVSGRLQSRKWQDRDGNNRTNWEINADSVYFGESRRDNQQSGNYQQNAYQQRGPVNAQPPQSFDGFQDMQGTGGQENPFTNRPPQVQPSAYQQAGLWDDMNDGELPF